VFHGNSPLESSWSFHLLAPVELPRKTFSTIILRGQTYEKSVEARHVPW